MGPDIDCWKFDLDISDDEVAYLRSILAPAELRRAGELLDTTAAARYAVGRGRLRELLSHYCGSHPRRLLIEPGICGKPRLVEPRTSLRFNLSHSGPLALCAVTQQGEVGVDVELRMVDPSIRWQSIARRMFTDAEICGLYRAFDPYARFLTLWTAKEACLKACGAGLGSTLAGIVDVMAVIEGGRHPVLVAHRNYLCGTGRIAGEGHYALAIEAK